MGQLLYEEDLVPDIILSSTARRACETAELAAEASGYEGEITYLEDLYHGWPSDYLLALRALTVDHDIAMVVGHNPGMEMLLDLLSGQDEHLPTAALAYIKLPIQEWSQLTDETEGELLALWLPRQLLD